MNTKFLGIFAVLFVALLGIASAIPVSVERVEIDDIQITEGQTNRLDITRGNAFEIEVLLNAPENVDDVEIEAFISGFEHNDKLRLADRNGPFDMDANVTYKKTLQVSLSDLVDEDDYKLRIIVSDRDGDVLVMNFPLKIDVARHDIKIVDVLFTPNKVIAGQGLLGIVRVENFGEKDEDDVKATVRIPEFGISASDYIEEIEEGDEEETEELFLRIPKCAEPGVYDAEIAVEYNNGFSRATAQDRIAVLEDPNCKEPEQEQVTVEVQQAPPANETVEAVPRTQAKVRTALEIILLVLVGLLVVIGLIVGLSRIGRD